MAKKIDKIAGVVVAVFFILALAAGWAADTYKQIPLGSRNAYEMQWKQLYDQLMQELTPDGNILYIQSNTVTISFYPDGTLKDFRIHILAQRTFGGTYGYDSYETSLQDGKLHLSKDFSHISMNDFYQYYKNAVISAQYFLKGLDQLPMRSMLEQYTFGSPAFYSISNTGISNTVEKSGRKASSSTFLYISGSGEQEFDMHDELNDYCVYFLIIPMYDQGQGSYRGDHYIVPFVDWDLVDY